MLLKLLKNMIIGILIGLSTSYIIVTFIILSDEGRFLSGSELLQGVLISASMGLVIGIANLIYESSKIPFGVQLTVHFLIVTLCVFCGGLVGDWFDFSDWSSILEIFVIEIIAYVIIWIIMLIIVKKEAKEINTMLKNRKGEQ